jgi:hypothetical protein
MPGLHLATFACDVTPPLGHPLCGGWIEPARTIADPLRFLGVVLLGMGRPAVLCAVDWCGIRNEAHAVWRQALADAAHTVPENVALHCVHPHDAPFADVEAQRQLAAFGAAPCLDLPFFEQVVRRSAGALRAGLAHAKPFTHIGVGQARVEQVASNRRVLGTDGKLKYWRGSSTREAQARQEPEGLIDPWLKTLSFWDQARPLAALHYYATHPMSYYGRGEVSSDFCGLARQVIQEEQPGIQQIYFTGCAGNIAAGKYNDGATANRQLLRDRMLAAMRAAWRNTQRASLDAWHWRTVAVPVPPRAELDFGLEASRRLLQDPRASKAQRGNAAFQIAWLKRLSRPLDVACLDLGQAAVLHLPGEPFIEYQLRAQQERKDRFVCVAGYGDGGPGYIPTANAYLQGGYEIAVALAGPETEARLHNAMRKLLQE